MDFNAETHLDGGTFTDQFVTDFNADHPGKDYTQTIKETGTPDKLFKRFIDTKSAHDAKLDGVIQRPAEGDETAKAVFVKLCRAGAGLDAPGDAAGYTFARAEGDGITEDQEKHFKDACLNAGVPDSIASFMFGYQKEMNAAAATAHAQALEEDHKLAVAEFQEEFKGEKLVETLRLAHDAMMQFGSDDVEKDGKTYDGFKSILKKADLYANPANFDKWREILGDGTTPGDIRAIRSYISIGQKMKSGSITIGAAGGKTAEQIAADQHNDAVRAVNALSPSLMAQIPG